MDTNDNSLLVLGSGNASVRRIYNTCFLLVGGDAPILVDGGGGNRIFHQLEAAGTALNDLHEAILTHAHTDHLFGMLWVLRGVASLMKEGRFEGNFSLYCHEELARFVRDFVEMSFDSGMRAQFGTRIQIVPVFDGERRSIAGRSLTFFDIRSKKLRQFGFCLELSSSRRLVFTGDEPLSKECRHLAVGADWLLTEAFCLASESGIFHPYEKHHSTVSDACKLAKELGVQNLVLWHTEESHGEHRKRDYMAEGRLFFPGRLFVPDDLERIPLDL